MGMSLLLASSMAESPLVDRFRRASLVCQTSSGRRVVRSRRRLPTIQNMAAQMAAEKAGKPIPKCDSALTKTTTAHPELTAESVRAMPLGWQSGRSINQQLADVTDLEILAGALAGDKHNVIDKSLFTNRRVKVINPDLKSPIDILFHNCNGMEGKLLDRPEVGKKSYRIKIDYQGRKIQNGQMVTIRAEKLSLIPKKRS